MTKGEKTEDQRNVSALTRGIVVEINALASALIDDSTPPPPDAEARALELYDKALDAYRRAGGGTGGTRDRTFQYGYESTVFRNVTRLAQTQLRDLSELQGMVRNALAVRFSTPIGRTVLYRNLRLRIVGRRRDDMYKQLGTYFHTHVFGHMMLPPQPPASPADLLRLTSELLDELLLWYGSSRHNFVFPILQGIAQRLALYSAEYNDGTRDAHSDTAPLVELYKDAADAYSRAGGGVRGGTADREWRHDI